MKWILTFAAFLIIGNTYSQEAIDLNYGILNFTNLPQVQELETHQITSLNYIDSTKVYGCFDPNLDLASVPNFISFQIIESSEKTANSVTEFLQGSSPGQLPVYIYLPRNLSNEEVDFTSEQFAFEVQHSSSLPYYIIIALLTRGEIENVTHHPMVSWISEAPDYAMNETPFFFCEGGGTEYGPTGEFSSNFTTRGEGWDGPGLGCSSLHYHFINGTNDMPGNLEESEVERALEIWEKYATLQFFESNTPGLNKSLDISWEVGAHGDGSDFDGPGGVLAHAFFPHLPNPEPIAGDLHFDDDEMWSLSGGGWHLFSVALHELGHALGLDHSNIRQAVMFPSISSGTQFTDLHQDDINGIRSLYGCHICTKHDNGWDKTYTNDGNDSNFNANFHDVGFDKFHVGDFDGDGAEEILALRTDSDNTMVLYDYVSGQWQDIWTNNGSTAGANHLTLYRENYIVGDYDGDGKDELLGAPSSGWMTVFSWDGTVWQWGWSDYGSHAMSPYKSNLIAGDYDGDGKDEILGAPSAGWMTMFNFDSGDFQWGWSNYGSSHAILPYRSSLRAGDFDGDGKDEILGNPSTGWATTFDFDNGDFHWGWSTYGAGNNIFGGWNHPMASTDVLLVGNIDSDAKDELLFLQNGVPAAWATSMDMKPNNAGWNWNWSGNPDYHVPYIGDWPISEIDGSNTQYFFVKADANKPKFLFAIRKYCDEFIANMYESAGGNKSLTSTSNTIDEGLDLKIHPNPTNDIFNVSFAKDVDLKEVKVFSQSGQLIKYDIKDNNPGTVSINLHNQPAGIYYLSIITAKGTTVKKLIKI